LEGRLHKLEDKAGILPTDGSGAEGSAVPDAPNLPPDLGEPKDVKETGLCVEPTFFDNNESYEYDSYRGVATNLISVYLKKGCSKTTCTGSGKTQEPHISRLQINSWPLAYLLKANSTEEFLPGERI
jgi:hypothetical protein